MKEIERLIAGDAEEAGTVHHLPAHHLGKFVRDGTKEIILTGRNATAVVVGKRQGTAEADIAIYAGAGAGYSQGLRFGRGQPILAINWASGGQACRCSGIADCVSVLYQRALELRIGNGREITFTLAKVVASHRRSVNLPVADVNGDGNRIAELTFVIADDLVDGGDKGSWRIADAGVPIDVDDQACTGTAGLIHSAAAA